jgi:RNA polymerase sigma-70 factor, ECF subfamily
MLADVLQTAFGTRTGGGLDEVARAAAGDVSAFESLYRAHLPRIHGLALRMAGPNAADELTQDVFVRAWQKLGSFRGESAFGTWLHRLAVNLIVEHFRRQNLARSRTSDDLAALDLAPAVTVAPTARMGLEAALETLPAGARRVFVLFDVEGYSHPEIAALLGTSVGTSKTQLHRARMLLRHHLTRRDHEV